MILTYVDILGDGQRHEIAATVTTDHLASSYGQPVVLPDDGGGPLDATSWVLMQYRIHEITAKEYALLQRASFFAPGRSGPGSRALAAATPKRRRVYLTLPDAEIARLREIGAGSASAGVSRILRERGG